MNLAEKLASAYLRLNGFLAIPQFTVFDGKQHNHIDLIALRAANSVETVSGVVLPTDDLLFNLLSEFTGSPARKMTIGVLAEVRTNDERDVPNVEHQKYARRFLGATTTFRIAFYAGDHTVMRNGDFIDIGIQYTAKWMQNRVNWMLGQGFKLSKTGSWHLSEDFLSDFLALHKHKLLS